jgi:hypothetical protein
VVTIGYNLLSPDHVDYRVYKVLSLPPSSHITISSLSAQRDRRGLLSGVLRRKTCRRHGLLNRHTVGRHPVVALGITAFFLA